jgi:hypothetical protein
LPRSWKNQSLSAASSTASSPNPGVVLFSSDGYLRLAREASQKKSCDAGVTSPALERPVSAPSLSTRRPCRPARGGVEFHECIDDLSSLNLNATFGFKGSVAGGQQGLG